MGAAEWFCMSNVLPCGSACSVIFEPIIFLLRRIHAKRRKADMPSCNSCPFGRSWSEAGSPMPVLVSIKSVLAAARTPPENFNIWKFPSSGTNLNEILVPVYPLLYLLYQRQLVPATQTSNSYISQNDYLQGQFDISPCLFSQLSNDSLMMNEVHRRPFLYWDITQLIMSLLV